MISIFRKADDPWEWTRGLRLLQPAKYLRKKTGLPKQEGVQSPGSHWPSDSNCNTISSRTASSHCPVDLDFRFWCAQVPGHLVLDAHSPALCSLPVTVMPLSGRFSALHRSSVVPSFPAQDWVPSGPHGWEKHLPFCVLPWASWMCYPQSDPGVGRPSRFRCRSLITLLLRHPLWRRQQWDVFFSYINIYFLSGCHDKARVPGHCSFIPWGTEGVISDHDLHPPWVPAGSLSKLSI